ncbi:hypothetical protein CDD83_4848 [Cordyceps sp. RAO-2017]|nr:hypothetical protein CDD83_4848 [Cordyceps sp. RAO-2017]
MLQGRLLAQAADYRAVLAGPFAADVLVVDVLPHAARALCDLGEIPLYATLGVIPLYTSVPRAPLPASGRSPPPEPGESSLLAWLRLVANAVRHAWNRWVALPLFVAPVINRQRAVLGLGPLPFGEPAECFAYSRHLHIQASSPTLEFGHLPRPRQLGAKTAFVGPLVLAQSNDSGTDRLPAWWPRVVAHERVIGITQGTLAMDPTSLIIPSIQALQHEPGTLLVVVSPHVKDIESRLQSPPNVFFAEWLPYHILLPQISLLITNGGYGSITQALAHKVPLLCAGQSEDKRDTAARVVWSGVGLDLKTDSPIPQQVRAAARTILSDDSYRARAQHLGDELNSLGGAERACDLLEELVTSSNPK